MMEAGKLSFMDENKVILLLVTNQRHQQSVQKRTGIHNLFATNWPVWPYQWNNSHKTWQTRTTRYGNQSKSDWYGSTTLPRLPVNKASDGAESLCYFQPRLTNAGEVVILGKTWNTNVTNWTDEILKIPCRDTSKGGKDDYGTLKSLVDELLNNQQLAKSVSIHNFEQMWPQKTKIGHVMK